MNENQAAQDVGYVVLKTHVCEMTAEQGKRLLIGYMPCAICAGIVLERIQRAIAGNQDVIRLAQNRLAELTALRNLLQEGSRS